MVKPAHWVSKAGSNRADTVSANATQDPDTTEAALRRLRLEALLGRGTSSAAPAQADPALHALMSHTAQMFAAALSEQTRKSYARRWGSFDAWCADQHLASLPADPETLMIYLAAMATADSPAAISTLRGVVAAVNRVHLEAGQPPPGDDPGIAILLRGYARSTRRPVARKQVDALRIAALIDVVGAMQPADARSVRDAALLALHAVGADTGFLAHVVWSGVAFAERSARLTVHPHRGSPTTTRLTVRDTKTLAPFTALRQWRAIATGTGPVFVAADQDGSLSSRRPHPSDLDQAISARLLSLGQQQSTAGYQAAIDSLLQPNPWTLRDRAMILLGFAGAFRRTEICALTWADLTEHDDGLVVLIRRSKTDPLGRGREIGIPYGTSVDTCPVTAVTAWRRRMETTLGERFTPELPCFVAIRRAGGVGTGHLSEASISRVLKERARAAAVPGNFGGRSLRAGFISTAADLNIPIEVIAKHSRHATMDNLLRYIRADDPFRRNAASAIGL